MAQSRALVHRRLDGHAQQSNELKKRRLAMRYLLAATVAGLLFLSTGSARAQNYDPAQLVQSWYARYLGRPADPRGLSIWVQHVRSFGAMQAQAGILGSDEYYARHGYRPEGFVQGLYVDVLGRTPSRREMHSWVSRLMVDGGIRPQLAQEFLTAAQPALAQQGLAPAPTYGPPPAYGAYPEPYGYYYYPSRPWRRYSW
jgi:hypothetical protein